MGFSPLPHPSKRKKKTFRSIRDGSFGRRRRPPRSRLRPPRGCTPLNRQKREERERERKGRGGKREHCRRRRLRLLLRHRRRRRRRRRRRAAALASREGERERERENISTLPLLLPRNIATQRRNGERSRWPRRHFRPLIPPTIPNPPIFFISVRPSLIDFPSLAQIIRLSPKCSQALHAGWNGSVHSAEKRWQDPSATSIPQGGGGRK